MRGAISHDASLSLGDYLSLAECESLVGKAILDFILVSKTSTWYHDYFCSSMGKLVVTKPFLSRKRFRLSHLCIEYCIRVIYLLRKH